MDDVDVEELAADDSSERVIDGCNAMTALSAHEIAQGNFMGDTIDTNDDYDSGVPVFRAMASRISASQHVAAVTKAKDLKRLMLEYGVPEVSIEIMPGRPSTYGDWDALYPVAEMSHHTVSRYSAASPTPVLALCKNGRSDLPGPLCNGYGGWDLCYRILTFGYANHSGFGGPFKVPGLTSGGFTIPQDSGRRYIWGTEWEGGINEADWDRELRNPRTGEQMTMREFMGRSNAALEEFLKIHPEAHLEHSTWTNRKIDRLGYTQAKGINEKKQYANPSKDEIDMADMNDIQKALLNAKIDLNVGGNKVQWRLERVLRYLVNQTVNEKKLVEAIVAAIPTSTGGFTPDELQAAVEKGIKNVLGGLDEN